MRSLVRFFREEWGAWRIARRLEARAVGLRIARGVEIRSPARLVVGRDVIIDTGAVLHCGGMDWSKGGGISVGDRTYVGPYAILFGAGGIEIGHDVLISPGVVVTSHQHSFADPGITIREQPVEFGKIVIEDDVWIGANAVILPGVRLGRGSVVGAGAVVTRDVPPGAVVVGVPGRVRGER